MLLVKAVKILFLLQALARRPEYSRRLWRDQRGEGHTPGNNTSASPYASIVPSETLNWVPCEPPSPETAGEAPTYSTHHSRILECARLLVSLPERGYADLGFADLLTTRSHSNTPVAMLQPSNSPSPSFAPVRQTPQTIRDPCSSISVVLAVPAPRKYPAFLPPLGWSGSIRLWRIIHCQLGSPWGRLNPPSSHLLSYGIEPRRCGPRGGPPFHGPAK